MSRKLNILLVDDDDAFVELVREVVRRDSAIFSRAHLSRLSDASELKDSLGLGDDTPASIRHWPDLILMDQRMPKMEGIEALKQLRQHPRTCTLPVCLLSSSNENKLVQEAYMHGANFCIEKPGELETLRTKLRKIVEFFTLVAELPNVERFPFGLS